MRASEFLIELFEPKAPTWEWVFRGSEEATADFQIGAVPYRFHAYSNGENDWEVEFKVRTNDRSETARKTRFGLTGTGNSAEVMSTVVDIMREFLEMYRGKIDTIGFTAEEPSRQKLYMRMMKRLLPDWTISTYDSGSGLGFTVVAPENLEEVFEPGKQNWKWARLGRDEVRALFQVGDRQYVWDAFTHRANPKKWEVQFRLVRNENDPDNLDLFGTTGTGNSAEVLSTAVDITRAFLKDYGLDNVEEITFNAKEDSRIALYAKMIKRLLPDWDLHSKKDPYDGMVFTLTDRRAYDKPENKLNEVGDTFYDVEKTSGSSPSKNMRIKHAKGVTPFVPKTRANFRFKTDSGTEYVINLSMMKSPKNGRTGVEVVFYDANENDNDNIGITNKGDAVKVFSTVKAVLTKFLSEHPKADVVAFSAKTDEPSRVKLYQTFANQFPRWFPKFSEQKVYKHPDYTTFAMMIPKKVEEASYEGNLGMMEMLKFFKVATPEEKALMKDLLQRGEQEEAWQLLQQVTGEELVDEGFADTLKKSAAAGAIALGALGAGNADAKIKTLQPLQKSAIVQPAKQQAPEEFNALSNNINNEVTLQRAAKKAGMKGTELAQFLAQMKHESWDFGRMKEKAQPGVKDYFAKRYDIKYSPKTARILGNKHAGDGARYHGRGFVQLTGRDNYRMAGEALGIDLLNHPELASKPDVASKIAVWYWQTRVKPYVQNFADTKAVTQKINPAMRGIDNRHANFKDYLRII